MFQNWQSSFSSSICWSHFLNVKITGFDKFSILLARIDAETTMLSTTWSMDVLFPLMVCSSSLLRKRFGFVKQYEYKVSGFSGFPANVSLGICITDNLFEVIFAFLLSVVMLTDTLLLLSIVMRNTSWVNKSLLMLKATFGSSVLRFLRSKVSFV